MDKLAVETKHQDGAVIIQPRGRLDAAGTKEFELATGRSLTGCKAMIVDLSHITHISSSALRVVLFAAKALAATGGRFAVSGMTPPVHDVFRRAGFLSILTAFETLDAALQNMRSPGAGGGDSPGGE